MLQYYYCLIFLFLMLPNVLFGQSSTLKEKWVGMNGVQIDTATVYPASIKVVEVQGPYRVVTPLLDLKGKIWFLDVNKDTIQSNSSSVRIQYRVLPPHLNSKLDHRSQDIYAQGGYGLDHSNDQYVLEVQEQQKREELFYAPNIQKTGSLTRGISMGNSQDVFVNSAMNLQLQGNITEDVALTATLTDQDIPFQPEGNTQQIQDFDKVYIELKHKNAQLAAGDIVMKNDPGVFLKYNKNAQGAQVKVLIGHDSAAIKSTTKAGISIAKGQFYSADVTPIDGVTGPYRLLGPNGESNIVVIANSEKVYIDGVLKQRGFDNDYTIDYNLSEITFNENTLITQYTRIRVDYEYATQYYSRTIFEASHQMKGKTWEGYFNFYQEKDDKNSSLFYSLSDEDKNILAGIGDSLQNAIAPAIDSVKVYDPNRILYTKVDTLQTDGTPTLCLRRANENDTPLYSAGFSDVGNNRGNYILKEITPFGRVYQWVSPEQGIRQGRYLPVRRLVAPNKKQMISLGGKVHLTKHESIGVEGAFSNQDQNLFSDKDDGDDQGQAIAINITSKDRELTDKINVSTFANLMYIDENFRQIDRFRSIEFDRNWSLTYDSIPYKNEFFAEGGITLVDKHKRSFSYSYAHRDREDVIFGRQQNAQLNYAIGRLNWDIKGFEMSADLLQEQQHSQWQRLIAHTFWKGDFIQPGYRYTTDKQQTKYVQTDSITSSWMNYEEHFAYLKQGDSLKWNYQLSFAHREDNAPKEGKLQKQTVADTYKLDVSKTGRKGKLSIGLTYRKWTDYFSSTPLNEESIQGRIVGGLNFGQGIGRLNGTYTVSSSRELAREFVYVRVEDGKGTHTWRDLNNDGIKDQNEFFLAQNPDERQYARFYTPTDEYLPAYRATLNLRLTLATPRNWKKEIGIKKLVSRFSNTSALLVDKKSLAEDILGRYSPFPNSTAANDMLAYKYSLRNTLFFNRSNPIYGADFRVVILENQQLLTQGRENRQDHQYTLGGRVNLGRKITCKLEGTQRDINSASEYLPDRNYTIDEYSLHPSVALQPSIYMRFTLGYKLKRKEGITNENNLSQFTDTQETSLEAKWSKASAFTISTKASAIFQSYTGEENTALAYEMLDALSVGTNFKWNVSWTQSLFSGLQLRMQYDGRKSEDTDVIHIGSMNLTALF